MRLETQSCSHIVQKGAWCTSSITGNCWMAGPENLRTQYKLKQMHCSVQAGKKQVWFCLNWTHGGHTGPHGHTKNAASVH